MVNHTYIFVKRAINLFSMALEFVSLSDFSLPPQIPRAISLFTRLMNAVFFSLSFVNSSMLLFFLINTLPTSLLILYLIASNS